MLRAAPKRKPWRVRTQLLVAVNVPLAIGLVLILAWDYRREIAQAADTKHANLANESVAIHRAVAHLLAERDEKGVQSYIDSVCHRMRASGSQHHTIIVDLQTRAFSSHSAHEPERRLLPAIKAASSREVDCDGDVLIVGAYSQPGMTVYIAESLTTARRQVRRLIFGRLAGLAALGLVAMLLVNYVVLQIVGRPIRMLVQTVERIRTGDYIEPDGPFSTLEFGKLADAVSLMSRTLREDENRRQSQMAKAREVQQHLLPRDITMPGLDVATWFAPAERVGGDYYDVIPLSDGSWLVALADVSGHGVASALEAAILKVLLEHAAEQTHDPAKILELVNGRFVDIIPEGHFATAFLLRWIPAENRVEYTNAGHIPGLFQTRGEGITELNATGFPIGIEQGAVWETQAIPIRENDRLLIVSDGVIESRSPQGELYGRDRLTNFVAESRCENSALLIASLRIDLAKFGQDRQPDDDTTMIAMEFTNQQFSHNGTLAESA